MRLTDIVSHAGLAFYAEVALLIFIPVFFGIVWWVMRPAHRNRWNKDARMPLDDVHPQQPRDED